jgi:hypothetical protein
MQFRRPPIRVFARLREGWLERMIQLRGSHVAVMLSVAAAVAAGCGSSGSKSPGASTPGTPNAATTPATPAEFSVAVNAVCKRFNAARPTLASTEAFLAKLIAFTPPTGEQEHEYDRFVTAEHVALAPGVAHSQSERRKAIRQEEAAAIALHAPDCAETR